MDVASARWFTEMGIEEYNNIFHHYEMNSLNHFGLSSDYHDDPHHILAGESLMIKQSLSSESYSSHSTITTKNNPSNTTSSTSNSVKNNNFDQNIMIRPSKQLKMISPNSIAASSQLLSFEKPNSQPSSVMMKPKKEVISQGDMHFSSSQNDHLVTKGHNSLKKEKLYGHDCETVIKETNSNNKRTYSSMTRTPSHAQDHIMAERKRREKLSQCFIALSSIVPGLKKMDKASVLGDAIKYVKELQERVNKLEEQTKKRTVESVVFVKKSQLVLSSEDDTSSSNESSDTNHPEEASLPEIEARVLDKDVLIRVHCGKQKGFAAKILSEVEKLHLSVLNTSVLPFGNSTLDVTILAQMEDEFSMTVKELVKNLRVALLKFM